MGDDEHPLERVGRAHPPALWIGGWALGLVAVAALAIAGRGGSSSDEAPAPVAVASASAAPVASASPGIPDSIPRVIRPVTARAPAPRPSPTLGDDGLVGGTSYSSAPPTE